MAELDPSKIPAFPKGATLEPLPGREDVPDAWIHPATGVETNAALHEVSQMLGQQMADEMVPIWYPEDHG